MSRLVESDVYNLANQLNLYDQHLRKICGTGLGGIAQNAAASKQPTDGIHVCVIPVTAGLGIIGGFCDAVADIIRFLGAEAQVTKQTDVKGIWEAMQQPCDVFFIADDHTFIAVHPASGRASDNSQATGRGFAAALDLSAGGLAGKKALVLGAGPVGCAAVSELDKRAAQIVLYDIDAQQAQAAAQLYPQIQLAHSLPETLNAVDFVLDATPAEGFLTHTMLGDKTVLAAPGVPLGIAQQSKTILQNRLIHDVLEIGVATMLMDVLR